MAEFNLIRSNVEIAYNKRKNIKSGCTLEAEPTILKTFTSKEEALEELQKHKTEIEELSGSAGKYFLVTEYSIENENGDTWSFSKMEIEVIIKPSYEVIGTYGNYAEAEDRLNDLEDGFISL